MSEFVMSYFVLEINECSFADGLHVSSKHLEVLVREG